MIIWVLAIKHIIFMDYLHFTRSLYQKILIIALRFVSYLI